MGCMQMKKTKEDRQKAAAERKLMEKHPETRECCRDCKNAPGPVRHALQCAHPQSPYAGQYVPRKGSCGEFDKR